MRWIRELIECGFSTRRVHGFLHCLGSEAYDPAACAAGLARHRDKLAELDGLIAVLRERRLKLSDRMSAMFGDSSSMQAIEPIPTP